jgi:DNA-binding transcriptional regulator PaaX
LEGSSVPLMPGGSWNAGIVLEFDVLVQIPKRLGTKIDAVRAALSRLFEGFEISIRRTLSDDPTKENLEAHRELVRQSLTWAKNLKAKVEDGTDTREDWAKSVAVKGKDELTYLIRVVPRAEALDGYDEELLPILRREPLHQAENNQRRSSVPS